MAEIIQKDGTWSFDGDVIRRVPGSDKSVGLLRRTLGEITVPLRALAGISYEPGKKAGRLRLRLRDGACPLLLWGFRKDPLMALVGAAVVARLPHPNAARAVEPPEDRVPAVAPAPAPAPADHDVLLRRLRELGELHQAGILTDEEFATAKQVVLRQL
ncbi:DUF4429 domain-containing protein [Streptomyces sp. NPDC093546]|uniref:DUF4429 domain-containing protein n=1 Tax=Streptomyces sp. NPDC093546 TaxID=3366040 RepID=UPI00381D053C